MLSDKAWAGAFALICSTPDGGFCNCGQERFADEDFCEDCQIELDDLKEIQARVSKLMAHDCDRFAVPLSYMGEYECAVCGNSWAT